MLLWQAKGHPAVSQALLHQGWKRLQYRRQPRAAKEPSPCPARGVHEPCCPLGLQGKLSLWCVTYLTLVGFFSCVYQIVLLEVSQLREAFIASLAFKRSLSAVHSEVHLGRNKAINNLQLPALKQKYFQMFPNVSGRLSLPKHSVIIYLIQWCQYENTVCTTTLSCWGVLC